MLNPRVFFSGMLFSGKPFSRIRLPLALVFALGVAIPAALPTLARAQTLAQTLGPAETSTEILQIITASGPQKFSVEVMRTDADRARGLMFRRSMPADRGMLFDFKREEPVMMWMKNTYIPLDMLFMDRSGKIVSIAENAEPLSERTIPSGPPAFAVLEVNAGTAARLGIKPGDRIQHNLFAK